MTVSSTVRRATFPALCRRPWSGRSSFPHDAGSLWPPGMHVWLCVDYTVNVRTAVCGRRSYQVVYVTDRSRGYDAATKLFARASEVRQPLPSSTPSRAPR